MQKKMQKIVIYLMVALMLLSSLLMGISFVF